MNGREFAQWMEDVKISLSDAAVLFGVSEQTLYNWRSTAGVPERKESWVRDRMAEFLRKSEVEAKLDRVTLEVTREQFIAWNRAALEAGKILYDWASDVLDREAAADADVTGSDHPFNPLQSLKVAESPESYGPRRSAADAKDGDPSNPGSDEGAA